MIRKILTIVAIGLFVCSSIGCGVGEVETVDHTGVKPSPAAPGGPGNATTEPGKLELE